MTAMQPLMWTVSQVRAMNPCGDQIDGNLKSLAAAQNDLNALRKSVHI